VALLFLSDDLRQKYPEVVDKILNELDVIKRDEIERGIIRIKCNLKGFEDNEFVLAKLKIIGKCHYITYVRKFVKIT
jgi:BMFP domain-containing protein YqiC